MKTLIINGRVFLEAKIEEGINLLVEDGIILYAQKDIPCKADKIIDANGLFVLPGLVDAHCHLRDPGFEYKEDIVSGTKSAAKGGFTSIACMPNTNPTVDNIGIVRYIIEKARKEGFVNVYPIGAITKGLEGKELSEMGSMQEAGIVAVSDDGKPVINGDIMRKALIYAGQFGLPVISHCEDLNITDGGSMNEGVTSTLLGLRGIPSSSEDVMVAREILLSEYTNIPVHIAHVSTKTSVELVRQAKKRGIKVTAETCPHYFTLTEKACQDYDTNTKMNPPLRSQSDLEAVIEGLRDDTIDIIATDHAPHHHDEKNVEFERAANGIVGFETALALSYTNLVEKGYLEFSQMLNKITVNPAKMLKLDKGVLECGKTADLILVDFDNEYTVDVSKFASKGKNSPFDGFSLKGKVLLTMVGGKISYSDDKLLSGDI